MKEFSKSYRIRECSCHISSLAILSYEYIFSNNIIEKILKSERFTLCNYDSKQYDDYRLLLMRRIIPSIESHQSQKYKIIKE